MVCECVKDWSGAEGKQMTRSGSWSKAEAGAAESLTATCCRHAQLFKKFFKNVNYFVCVSFWHNVIIETRNCSKSNCLRNA